MPPSVRPRFPAVCESSRTAATRVAGRPTSHTTEDRTAVARPPQARARLEPEYQSTGEKEVTNEDETVRRVRGRRGYWILAAACGSTSSSSAGSGSSSSPSTTASAAKGKPVNVLVVTDTSGPTKPFGTQELLGLQAAAVLQRPRWDPRRRSTLQSRRQRRPDDRGQRSGPGAERRSG